MIDHPFFPIFVNFILSVPPAFHLTEINKIGLFDIQPICLVAEAGSVYYYVIFVIGVAAVAAVVRIAATAIKESSSTAKATAAEVWSSTAEVCPQPSHIHTIHYFLDNA